MIDIQEFLDLPQFAGYTDLEFCEWMIKNIGVAAVPGSSFFRENVKQSDPSAFCTGGENDRRGTGAFEEIKGVAVR